MATAVATMEELGVLVEDALKFVISVRRAEGKGTLQCVAQMVPPIPVDAMQCSVKQKSHSSLFLDAAVTL